MSSKYMNEWMELCVLQNECKSNIFLNEQLTKHNDVANKACYLKKQGEIRSTWKAIGKIFIKLNRNSEDAEVLLIKTI